MIDTIFFSSLKDKKFKTRSGEILRIIDFYATCPGEIIINMVNENGKNFSYNGSCGGGEYFGGIKHENDIVEIL